MARARELSISRRLSRRSGRARTRGFGYGDFGVVVLARRAITMITRGIAYRASHGVAREKEARALFYARARLSIIRAAVNRSARRVIRERAAPIAHRTTSLRVKRLVARRIIVGARRFSRVIRIHRHVVVASLSFSLRELPRETHYCNESRRLRETRAASSDSTDKLVSTRNATPDDDMVHRDNSVDRWLKIRRESQNLK